METNKSFDPNEWVNPVNENEQQKSMAAPVSNTLATNAPNSLHFGDNEFQKARAVCDELLRIGANIAESEDDYYRLLQAMADLGEDGKELCRQLCQQSAKYEERDFEYKWRWSMNNNRRAIHIASFYETAKKNGIDLSAISRQFYADSAFPHGDSGKYNEHINGSQNYTEHDNYKPFRPSNNSQISETFKSSSGGAEMRNQRKTQAPVTEEYDYERFVYNETFSDKLSEEELPSLLREVMATQQGAENKDKVTLAALTLWSGEMPNVRGLYRYNLVSSPFYTLFNAPSGIANKGAVEACLQLVMPIEWEIRRKQQEEFEEYERQSAEFRAMDPKKRKDMPEPKEPKYRSVFIAGNSSSAVFYECLDANGGRATVFETEADVLASVLSQDWGQWSDLLRRAYHHERLTLSRKQDHIHVVIENPELSVLLTCTPGQIPALLPATQVENGLANRFLFYCMKGAEGWENPFKQGEEPLKETMLRIGQRYLPLYHELCKREDSSLEFTFSDSQKMEFNAFFKPLYDDQIGMNGRDLAAFVFRLGLATFRIAMTLTVLRCADQEPMLEPLSRVLVCNDSDFHTAKTIANTLINHTCHVWTNLLPHVETPLLAGVNISDRERQFFLSLTDEFTTDIWKEKAQELHIPIRTAERYVGYFVNKYHLVTRIQNGQYKINTYQRP